MKYLIHTSIATFALLCPLHAFAQGAANCPNPIPIAVTAPLTSGMALIGVQARNGVQDAIDEINAAGGIGGKKFSLAVEDATASAPTALNSLNRLLEGKPVVVFSSMISTHIFTQAEVIKKAEVPFLFAGTNTQLTRQNIPWFFRIHVHDGQLADMVPRYIVETMKKTKPAILAVSDDYGLGASKDMQKTFEALNVKVVAVETYGATDKDMSAQLTSIKNKGADVILLWGRPADATIVMKQHKALGIGIPIVGNSSVASTAALNNLTAEEADGALAIGGMFPQPSQDPAAQAFIKRVTDKTRVPPDNFAVAYRDAMYIVKTTIERVGCEKKAIRDELAKLKDWKGMFITYTADPYGDLAHTLGIYRNKGRESQLIGTISERGF
jgi:branched-chain amino acid transport system substrate-binding protein